MRTHDGYDALDSYECVRDAMGENVCNGNDDIEFNGRRFQGTPFEVAATMRSLIKSQESYPSWVLMTEPPFSLLFFLEYCSWKLSIILQMC